MTTFLRLVPLLLLVVCLGQPLPAARADTVQVFAHLFIVPATLADGSDAAPRVPEFEAWLTETYGGYTRLGTGAGGWKNETGQIETEVNTTYLTTAGRDCSKDIAARLVQEFGMRVPYVLVLPAEAFATRSR